MSAILITLGFSASLAFALGLALGVSKRIFHVEQDPNEARIREALPGVNCGGCGYPGCDGYAAAVAAGVAPVDKCAPGGKSVVEILAGIMGVSASSEETVAVLHCQGNREKAALKGNYVGVPTCRAAKLSAGGTKVCAWGCMGYGDCALVCRFDALRIGGDGLPRVDYDKCTGCGMCVSECPQSLYTLVSRERKGSVVLCRNRSVVKPSVAKACKVGCIKCEICVRNCPEKCIAMENGVPMTDYPRCTSCGVCATKCPTKCYRMLEDGVFRFAPAKAGEPAAVAT
ncbi:MAG TPA: RnfABCDGE type electron transport complex subunit B [Magnetospirillaceae bacterium]|nr:RnfABCDGE type electron transport complex subunit B [Magnetospirillaceae bacterium]